MPENSFAGMDSLSATDFNKKHELSFTPTFGYRELVFLESPINYVIFYADENHQRASLVYGCSLDYFVAKNVKIGIEINYQTIPFSSLSVRQNAYFQFASTPYSLTTTPEFECSFDYFQSYYSSIGLTIGYMNMQCSSMGAQLHYYPYSMQFDYFNIGVRKLYYFNYEKNSRWHFYIGVRADLTIWNESDNWSSGFNDNYQAIINSENEYQLSFLVLGGIRYTILSFMDAQLESGFGINTPYYIQAGITLKLK
jgi:hypothetical protein